MNVIVEPPPQVRPGQVLSPPVVIRLERAETEENDINPSLLFAFVSITSEDGSTSLAPPRNDLIAGNLSDSVHTLDSDTESDDEEVGFLSFPDLRIQDPGSYRLRVSLMRMDVTSTEGPRGAMNLQSTLSRVIHVDDEAEESSPGSPKRKFACLKLISALGEQEAALLENLGQRGLRTR